MSLQPVYNVICDICGDWFAGPQDRHPESASRAIVHARENGWRRRRDKASGAMSDYCPGCRSEYEDKK